MARFTPFVAGSYVNSRSGRATKSIRARGAANRSVTLGTNLRVSAKTAFVVGFRRFDAEYDDQETLVGAVLASELNRREESTKVQLRYAMTPFTTFVVDTELGRDRFEVASVRDSDSIKVMPGFELKPAALVSGNVFVGFRRFDPLTTSLPDYRGIVAAVKARYIRSATRCDLVVDRDVAYSFEPTQPYYVLLDTGITVTQRVTRRWDVVGRGSLQRLAYRDLDVSSSPRVASAVEEDRVDRGGEYGGGVGFRLDEDVRLGLDVSRDDTPVCAFRTARLRRDAVFGSISYGIQQ